MFAVGWSYSSFSLPYKDADRLVEVYYENAENNPDLLGLHQPFLEWKERRDVFTDVAARRRAEFNILLVKTGGGSILLWPQEVTANFFDMLGVSFPGIQAWKKAVNIKYPLPVVLDHKTGFNYFGHESIGKLFPAEEGGGIVVNGILPENFVSPFGGSAFVPIEIRHGMNDMKSVLVVYARLAPGVTPQLAEQMLSVGTSGIRTSAGGPPPRLKVQPWVDSIVARLRPIVIAAWAMRALILVLCAANLGGILLTRTTYRLREYALRAALGASLSNLVRTLLLEICGIAVIAALVAAYAAWIAMPYIADRVPVILNAFGRPVFEWEAVIFIISATAAVMLVIIAAAALLPAMRVLRIEPARSLNSE